jgi:hypothetical protein
MIINLFQFSSGTYSFVSGAIFCQLCSEGTFSNNKNSTVCQSCSAGFYTDVKESTSCQTCMSGFYSVNLSPQCMQCSPGFFSPKNGSSLRDVWQDITVLLKLRFALLVPPMLFLKKHRNLQMSVPIEFLWKAISKRRLYCMSRFGWNEM